MTLGTWGGPGYPDQVTFGCRIGRVEGTRGPQCSLVGAAATREDTPLFGTKLSREQALAHPRLPEFWACIDWLVLNDPLLHEHAYHLE